MKKDIYIIRNKINKKVYIGQAKDAAKRWLNHIYNAKYENRKGLEKQVIHKAMSKYGYENFYYEILESQITNYDEREKYWINYYNSIVPNGYNVSVGGNGAGCGLEHPNSLIKDNDTLMRIVSEISSSKKTFSNIAKKYHLEREVISAINNGYRYRLDFLKYPLRNTDNRYSNDLVKQIRYSLKHEDYTVKQLSRIYNVDASQISEINQGKIYYVYGEEYPLRKKRKTDLDEHTVDLIINDIVNSNLGMCDIAKKYGITKTRITGINKGTFYSRKNLVYPLREEGDKRNKGRKNFLDREKILQIHELLRSNMDIKEIAERYDTTKTTIYNINSGKAKRYHIENVKYPIRDNRKLSPVSTICA